MSPAYEPPPGKATDAGSEPEGGDAACWAALVCPDCGAVEAGGHRDGCPRADAGDGGSAPGPH